MLLISNTACIMNGATTITLKRNFLLLTQHFKNYYEALGVSPKATQADIKAAYYKLSMIYHPDRNQGCKDSATKFHKIKSAYEVLSDYNSRKLYDRGMSIGKEDTSFSDFGKSSPGIVKKSRPVTTGRSPIYDYDAWSRAHYGESFSRKVQAKHKREFDERFNEQMKQSNMASNIMFGFFILMTISVCYTLSQENHDDFPKSFKKSH